MKTLRSILFAATAAATAVPALAQEGQPDQEAMMKAYMQASMPGPGHAFLAKMAGDYTYAMVMYDDPAHPATYTGTSTKSMILGGRYLQETDSGEMMGMPFNGMGITTYNNTSKKYETMWIDNMGSFIMTCNDGTLDGNTMTMKFEYMDPVTKMMAKVKTVTELVDDAHHTMTYYTTMPDGSEMKMFSLAYAKTTATK
jgi:Protein of unknown function (DUF1579)